MRFVNLFIVSALLLSCDNGFQTVGSMGDQGSLASSAFGFVQISAPNAGDEIQLDVGDNLNLSVTVTTANSVQQALWQKFDTTTGAFVTVPGTTTQFNVTQGQMIDELILNSAQASSSGRYRASVVIKSLDLATTQTFYGAIVQIQVGPQTTSPAPTANPTPVTTAGNAIFNCSAGFSTSGPCGASLDGYSSNSFIADGVPYINGTPAQKLVGSHVDLIPAGTYHVGVGFNYQKPVSVEKFTASFTFIPDGYNIAFVLQNNTNTAAGKTKGLFSAGAGCESGFFQAFPTPTNAGSTNNVFALELAQDQPLNDANGIHGYDGTAPFEYSTAQIFSAGQSPCNPGTTEPNYVYYPHLSTYPVSLNSPYNATNTTTGHVYSVTINYDGSNVVMNMYDTDKSVGGSCPGAKCYTHTWSGVNISKLVGGSTAYVGLTAGIPSVYSMYPLYVNSFSYSVP